MNSPLQLNVQGELWIPRTMWEKRRQLSAVIHRAMSIGRQMLILSCDSWTTFFGRIDIPSERSTEALATGQIDYMKVSPLIDVHDGSGADLSRVLGEIGLKYHDRIMDIVIVDDVDLLVDFSTEESVKASMFALSYALQARFKDIALFTNPLRTDREIQLLGKSQEFLAVHYPQYSPQQGVA